MTSTLTLAECKCIVSQLIDSVSGQSNGDYIFLVFDKKEKQDLQKELNAVDNIENLACILDDVIEWVNKEINNNQEWWPDEIDEALEQAQELKQIL